MPEPFTYPFGQPVRPRTPIAAGPRRVFVLGAYPSALHIKWTSPDGSRTIRALPVDDEPEPLWTGEGEIARIERWKTAVGFDAATHGTASTVGALNGSSGVALDRDYLVPLGVKRKDTCITDCLPIYHASEGVRKAIHNTLVDALGSAAGGPHLPSHPSESAIVKGGKEPARLAALSSELSEAAPETVITLGNAAAAVFAAMLNLDDAPQKLQTEAYGEPITLPSALTWWPLAHPGAVRTIPKWRDAHAQWKGAPKA